MHRISVPLGTFKITTGMFAFTTSTRLHTEFSSNRFCNLEWAFSKRKNKFPQLVLAVEPAAGAAWDSGLSCCQNSWKYQMDSHVL